MAGQAPGFSSGNQQNELSNQGIINTHTADRGRRWMVGSAGVAVALWLGLTACAAPTPAPSATRLYFLARTAEGWNLATLNEAGEVQPLLTDVTAFAPGPHFAVVTNEEQTLALWDLKSPGASTPLHPCTAPCRAPAWSPDGQLLAWVEGDPLPAPVWVMTFRSRDARSLGLATGHPAWAPQGQRLAFPTTAGLVVWDLSAGTALTLPLAAQGQPAWSPDGTQLAVVLASGQAVLVDPVTALTVPLTLAESQTWAEALAWSPDGTGIALVRQRFAAPPEEHDGDHDERLGALTLGPQPALVEAATGSLHELPGDPAAGFAHPVWSGDGSQLALVQLPLGVPAPRPAIWLVEATTGHVTARLPGTAAPAWGP